MNGLISMQGLQIGSSFLCCHPLALSKVNLDEGDSAALRCETQFE
jgi:hypothetical protein